MYTKRKYSRSFNRNAERTNWPIGMRSMNVRFVSIARMATIFSDCECCHTAEWFVTEGNRDWGVAQCVTELIFTSQSFYSFSLFALSLSLVLSALRCLIPYGRLEWRLTACSGRQLPPIVGISVLTAIRNIYSGRECGLLIFLHVVVVVWWYLWVLLLLDRFDCVRKISRGQQTPRLCRTVPEEKCEANLTTECFTIYIYLSIYIYMLNTYNRIKAWEQGFLSTTATKAWEHNDNGPRWCRHLMRWLNDFYTE